MIGQRITGGKERNGRSNRYRWLLEDMNVWRWFSNLAQGSTLTANVRLRRLGYLCMQKKLTPEEMVRLARQDPGWGYNFLIELVDDMAKRGYAGSYIDSVKKTVISWLRHNGIEMKMKVKVKGAYSTPTLHGKGPLDQSQLRTLFSCSPPNVRVVESLMCQAGLRPETIGNETGEEGLRLGDISDLEVDEGGRKLSFKQVPAMIVVREELSKAGHRYFTFLPREGCEFLLEYLKLRVAEGEILSESSPVVAPGSKRRKNTFVRTTLLGRMVKLRLKECAINARPYDLRSTFATQLMLAESKGMMIRDYRVFFMGHKGDIEQRYTLGRNKLPDEVLRDMRNRFASASRHLESSETVASGRSIEKEIKMQMLLVAGFTEEEVEEQKMLELPAPEVMKKVREKVYSLIKRDSSVEKLVSLEELGSYLERGWKCKHVMESRDLAVISSPEL